ncbi:hypothetical protein O181_037701 [Austropuccinia psidii MF-1]|uniref:Retrovirus-related Pol polyprotein from transposon TNT 1-94-like beta-barrel domain-containing protein n=1 Tax=Austropuccinia psidii MF-1 TaxID=1389203 RepID=A0A9Q3D6P7_9BASI|nr:hypothetical protein [Austropuccinia psidii MF-1]
MTNKNLDKEESYILLLDGANYTKWHLRMCFLLCSRYLLDVCENSVGQDVSTNAINQLKKLSFEEITLITSQINQQVFLEVDKCETSDKANLLWSEHQFKITHYCSKSLHNPKCTTHRKEDFYAKNPHLRPPGWNNKRKIHGSPAAAHLVTARALISLTISSSNSSNQIVIGCSSTHHMFCSNIVFSYISNVAKFSIATGDSSSNLLAEGIGPVTMMVSPKFLKLTNCLYILKLNCNLVSLMQLFHNKLTITKKFNTFSLRTDDNILFDGKIINNLMMIYFP